MSDDEIPEYQRPRETCLAAHEDEIVKLREKGWPYRAILKRLEERHQVSVVYSTLREFCLRRDITKDGVGPKGRKSSAAKTKAEPSPPSSSPPDDDLLESLPRKKLRLKVMRNSKA
ncbi:hypothetical protein ACFQY0_20200 [Haloferula chungangensis]|uniref:Helix-turn-helix domain-containing protein n=1 Tax=Haloferula chungangensis TaxID=1048331 RepID=A0ABW2LEF9_9BACT